MNLIQRVILCLGANTLMWIWIHPPVYRLTSDGRLEHNLYYVWQVPMDWSVNLPMVGLRLLTVVLVTTAFYLAFRPGEKKGAA
ncbi:hypothetical protein Verru16b_00307 [Lacunisphaera limnophila]|uniref:Uncharacterized protein n=1 Tax=Lacunisphaera limnophila TaxID=1838286 RepID=A0A1D8AR09_9BACT|nr:hypothetical protein [Lacunisphaera limnophila]AOS43264.1 hypothetical protein Verru16b_00307 [Lacunisphaera limnophila]